MASCCAVSHDCAWKIRARSSLTRVHFFCAASTRYQWRLNSLHGCVERFQPVCRYPGMEQIEQLISVLRATPSLMRVLDIARALHLPDPLVFSGAVYQPVRTTTWLISTLRTSPMRPKTRSSGGWQQLSMSRFVTWSRSAIRRVCTFGSSANLASRIHLFLDCRGT